MHPACKTLYYFAWYPFFAGMTMMLVPALPLQIFNFPAEGLDWIRMLGVVTTIVSYYYWRLSKDNVVSFCRYSAQMRISIPLVFIALVLLFDMPPLYIALTAGDVAGGLWTAVVLRQNGMTVFARA
ncbi:MAG: hypothetical protein ACSHXK_08370 [Oceanococcus sp.]